MKTGELALGMQWLQACNVFTVTPRKHISLASLAALNLVQASVVKDTDAHVASELSAKMRIFSTLDTKNPTEH